MPNGETSKKNNFGIPKKFYIETLHSGPTQATSAVGAGTQTCTGDAGLFRPALYYLSYPGKASVTILILKLSDLKQKNEQNNQKD